MKLTDIPKPKLKRSDSEALKTLKRDGPRHLRALINRSSVFAEVEIADLGAKDVQLLGGGVNAVTYLVRRHNDYVVVKFDLHTMKAEAEALEAWWQEGAKVVQVKSTGTSPLYKDGHTTQKVRYIILEGVLGSANRPAEPALDYVIKYPQEAERVGRAMGRQLALMHRATTKRSFGEFADMHDGTKSYRTWNAFLMGYVTHHSDSLRELGYSDNRIKAIKRQIRTTAFSRVGRYLHGDFSLRNALVESRDPLKIRIIDPNPLVGNILWDLSIACNNAEIAHRKAFMHPGDTDMEREARLRVSFWHGVNEGYRRNTKRKIRSHKFTLVRTVHLLMLTMIVKYDVEQAGGNYEDDVSFVLHRNLLSELVVKALRPVQK
jgi:fructosamine-3-kinase